MTSATDDGTTKEESHLQIMRVWAMGFFLGGGGHVKQEDMVTGLKSEEGRIHYIQFSRVY